MFDSLRQVLETSITIAAFCACAWLTAGPIAGFVTAGIVAAVLWQQTASRACDFLASRRGT